MVESAFAPTLQTLHPERQGYSRTAALASAQCQRWKELETTLKEVDSQDTYEVVFHTKGPIGIALIAEFDAARCGNPSLLQSCCQFVADPSALCSLSDPPKRCHRGL